MAETLSGSCLCEGIRFTITGLPEKVVACYCTDCQKNAGGPYQVICGVKRGDLSIQDPENLESVYTIAGGTVSGFPKEKRFCKRCGCTLWTVPLKHEGKILMVRTALIEDGLAKLRPGSEFFTTRRPAWIQACEGAVAFERMPGKPSS